MAFVENGILFLTPAENINGKKPHREDETPWINYPEMNDKKYCEERDRICNDREFGSRAGFLPGIDLESLNRIEHMFAVEYYG